MAPEAPLSPSEQARVDAGKVNAAREKEALKNTGPVSKSYDPTTGKTTTTAVAADDVQKIGNFEVTEDEKPSAAAKS